mmetsp:Transcript_5730/g.13417  ORF Transcript_5730/g.13417 Transcript_5730/m.13417 type:complete len:109 (+) Transcript_5730:189-515(+)
MYTLEHLLCICNNASSNHAKIGKQLIDNHSKPSQVRLLNIGCSAHQNREVQANRAIPKKNKEYEKTRENKQTNTARSVKLSFSRMCEEKQRYKRKQYVHTKSAKSTQI